MRTNVIAAEGLITALDRNWEMIDAALEGLDEATLSRRPDDECNSIAWIMWHLNRVVDSFIHTRLQGAPQLWVQDGWHQKFGMSDDPEDRGVGWTAEQVGAWKAPSREVQLGYHEAIRAKTREYLLSLTYADLEERKVIPPAAQPRSVAAALGQMTWDAVAHGGQIAYLRGLYRGMGWHR
jgi:DinB family protein